jgi:hypothetical protein
MSKYIARVNDRIIKTLEEIEEEEAELFPPTATTHIIIEGEKEEGVR